MAEPTQMEMFPEEEAVDQSLESRVLHLERVVAWLQAQISKGRAPELDPRDIVRPGWNPEK